LKLKRGIFIAIQLKTPFDKGGRGNLVIPREDKSFPYHYTLPKKTNTKITTATIIL
jgi:hypothetical protein